MTRADFERLVHEGIERIPAQFRRHLDEVAVVVEREPSLRKKREAVIPRTAELLGLYEGTPRTERAYLPYRLPEKITLFQGPIERMCGNNAECIREQVAHTVWHELAHALGMSERRIRALERKRTGQKKGP